MESRNPYRRRRLRRLWEPCVSRITLSGRPEHRTTHHPSATTPCPSTGTSGAHRPKKRVRSLPGHVVYRIRTSRFPCSADGMPSNVENFMTTLSLKESPRQKKIGNPAKDDECKLSLLTAAWETRRSLCDDGRSRCAMSQIPKERIHTAGKIYRVEDLRDSV